MYLRIKLVIPWFCLSGFSLSWWHCPSPLDGHSFNGYLLGTYYGPETVLGVRDKSGPNRQNTFHLWNLTLCKRCAQGHSVSLSIARIKISSPGFQGFFQGTYMKVQAKERVALLRWGNLDSCDRVAVDFWKWLPCLWASISHLYNGCNRGMGRSSL